MKRRRKTRRRFWTALEERKLRGLYPHKSTKDVAAAIGRQVAQVYQHANAMGLKKTAEYLASPAACRLRRGDEIGKAFRFAKGQRPWNADLKGVYKPGGRAPLTQFKKGNRPHTWQPIGSTRLTKEGYLQHKMTDTGCTRRDWVSVHVLLWRQHHGDIPSGHAVVFKDGDKKNIVIGNLELIHRSELMRRNSVHRLPKEVSLAIQLVGALNRQIRKRVNEKHNGRPAQPSI